MNFNRQDGEFDYGGFAAMCTLGLFIVGVLYGLAIRPLELAVLDNKNTIKQNELSSHQQAIVLAKMEVLATEQNKTLTGLSMAINKLADKIDDRNGARNDG